MANLYYLEQKSIEEEYPMVQPPEELDKLNYDSIPEGYGSTILLTVFAIIPMAILIILFS